MASFKAQGNSIMGCVMVLAVLLVAGQAAALTNVGGRHLLQGNGGNGGSGGAGGSSAGGTPGAGGASGAGGSGGNNGSPGSPGTAGRPGGFIHAFAPIVNVLAPKPKPKPTGCTAGSKGCCITLVGVLIQSVSKANAYKSCATSSVYSKGPRSNAIGNGKVRVSLLLPNKNQGALSGLTAKSYNPSTISLGGVRAKQSHVETAKGQTVLRVDFDDTKGVLKHYKNKIVLLTGVYRRADNVNLCFSTPVKICA